MSITFEDLAGEVNGYDAQVRGQLPAVIGTLAGIPLGAGQAIVASRGAAVGGHIEAEEEQGDLPIVVPVTAAGTIGMSAALAGGMDITAQVDAAIALVSGGVYAGVAAPAAGSVLGFVQADTAVRGSLYEVQPAQAFAFLVPEGPVAAIHCGVIYERAAELVAQEADDDNLPLFGVVERASLAWDGIAALRTYSQLADGLVLGDVLAIVLRELIEEGLSLEVISGDGYTAMARVIDGLVLSGVAGGWLEARQLVIEALALHAAAGWAFRQTIEDLAGAASQVQDALHAAELLAGDIEAAAEVDATATLVVVLDESAHLAGEVASLAELLEAFQDGVSFGLRMGLDSGEYIAHVMNTGSKAHSTYSNYPFNSFAVIGGVEYGMTDAGIHRLEGGDDAGSPIKSRVRTAMTSMGVSNLKRFRYAYLGMIADGDMCVKVITVDSKTSERRADWYRMKAGSGGPAPGRVKIGEGLRSVYWSFELESIDGTQFELDYLKMVPIMLEQRMDGQNGGKR